MQLREVFANVLANPKQVKAQSKEQFFTTKHRQKRMKKSTCFSEQIEIEQNNNLDSSLNSIHSHHPLNGCSKELDSTFGEETALAFKIKPPKRKRNVRSNLDQPKTPESSSSSASHQSPKKSLIFCKKTVGTPKHEPQGCSNSGASSIAVGNFHIICKVGEGSYSQVFKAVERATGFVCALKVLQKRKMKQLKVEENVIREIKLHMFLNHPNIARLYGCFHDHQYIYLVCQYATDNNLYSLIKQPRKELDKATRLVGQICEAIRYIHNNYVIHRDIKPENILLTMGSIVKLCDFGWSVYNPSKQMRLTLCGTPLYLAPEMVAQVSYDESIDIWAIGVITYQLLTDQSPFNITQLRDLRKIIHQDINLQLITNLNAANFILNAMEKDPNKRKSVFQLCRHPFISHFLQSNQFL